MQQRQRGDRPVDARRSMVQRRSVDRTRLRMVAGRRGRGLSAARQRQQGQPEQRPEQQRMQQGREAEGHDADSSMRVRRQ